MLKSGEQNDLSGSNSHDNAEALMIAFEPPDRDSSTGILRNRQVFDQSNVILKRRTLNNKQDWLRNRLKYETNRLIFSVLTGLAGFWFSVETVVHG